MELSWGTLFAAVFVGEWIVRFVMLFVVPYRRKPSSANAWLLLIMVMPTVGMVLYFMFGNPKLPKTRRNKRREVDLMTEKELNQLQKSHSSLFPVLQNDDYQTLARLGTVLGGLPPVAGNKIEFLSVYDDVFSSMVKDIDTAKSYIHVEFFIVALDSATRPLFESLQRAVDRGVTVRFLYDRVVSRRYPGHAAMRKFMQKAGIECREMLPLSLVPGKNFTRPDLRNHRKILIIDGKVAFSGSQNIIDKSYHRKDALFYEEVVTRMQGPIVWQCNNVFRADWFAETNEPLLELVEDADVSAVAGSVTAQILPSGPSHEHDNNLKFYTSMVHAAKKRVGIVVPYFIPDESFFDALTAAAQRGVEVTMINSEIIDKVLAGHSQRSYYEELLEAGAAIYLYEAPIFLHTKQLIIDDDVAIIGSSNLDIRSFELDLEMNTILYDKTSVKQLKAIESGYLKRSKKVELQSWRNRPLRHKMLQSVSRLTAALQ